MITLDLFNNGPIVVFVWKNEPDWPIESVSNNLLNIYGYNPLQYLSKELCYKDQIHPDDLSRVSDEVTAASKNLESDFFVHQPYRYLDNYGEYRWVKDSSQIIRSKNGEITHYIGYIIDVSPEIKLQEETNYLKERLDLAWNGTNDGLWEWDIKQSIVYFSPRWKEMIGYEPDEFPNEVSAFFDAIHPEDKGLVENLLNRHFTDPSNTPYEIDIRLRCKNGEYKWIRTRGKTSLDADGIPCRMGGSHTDISKDIMLRKETEYQKQIYQYLIKNASDSIFIMNTQGRLLECSQQAAQLLGYTMDEMKNLYVYDWDISHTKEEALSHIRNTPSQPMSFKTKHRCKNGSIYDAAITVVKIHIAGNDYIYASVRDITKLKEKEKEKERLFTKALKSEKNLLHLLEITPIALRIARIDNNKIVFSNNTYMRLIQTKQSDIINIDLTHYYAKREEYETIVARIKNKELIYNQLIELSNNNQTFWTLASYMPIEFDGEPCVLGWFYDITEQKQLQESLEKISLELKREQIFLQTLINSAPISFFYKDLEGKYINANDLYSEFIGLPREDIIGKSVFDIFPFEIATKYNEKDLELLANPKETQIYEYIAKNILTHEKRAVLIYKKVFFDEKNQIAGIVGSALDITKQKQIQDDLTRQKEEYENIFNMSKDGIAILDIDSNFLDFNQTYLEITGFSREELLGTSCIKLSAPEDRERSLNAMKTILEKGFITNLEKNCIVKDGKRIFVNMSATLLNDKKRFLISTQDISEKKKHELELEYNAHYDILTGLPNRILHANYLYHAMAQSTRNDTKIAILYLDLDGFKEVNDHYGHAVGDQLLIELAKQLKQALRESDILSRFGGDEFVAIIVDLVDISVAYYIIQRLLATASRSMNINDCTVQVSASIGVTFYPQREEVSADQLIREADQAMYIAKQSGKNRFHVFDSEHDRKIRVHNECLEKIKQASLQQEFVLYYQPKINLRTNKLIGAEALIRWIHPERGIIPPLDFLPMIENNILSIEIGEWVINQSIEQIKYWHSQGLDLVVSINVGAKQLLQGNFVERLHHILANHSGFDPSLLEIEILETSALEDVELAAQIIEECKALGIRFALDDFGTGYSSLTYLKRLPVAVLKIDQSFVRDMLTDIDNLVILEGIISLASAFGREVIAEGVETVEHAKQLLSLECDIAQGYGIARPMPSEMFFEWSQKWNQGSILY